MSYSLNNQCHECAKKCTCTDRCVIQGAICGIHEMPYGVGHLGAGTIDMNCSNFEPQNEQAKDQG